MSDTEELTDAEIDASLKISDRLVDEIEALFAGEEAADCVMALATVFGRCIARCNGTEAENRERFRHFSEAAAFEAQSERLRRAN